MLALGGILFLTGCRPLAKRSERTMADWSRGEKVGETVLNARPALLVDRTGAGVYLAWVSAPSVGEAESLYFVRLDGRGSPVVARELALETRHPTQVALLPLEGGLAISWLDRLQGHSQLSLASLSFDGELLSAPRILSPPGQEVDSYALLPNPEGGGELLWSVREGQARGLYHLHLNGQGQPEGEVISLGREGFQPALAMGEDGVVHLAWLEEPEYSRYVLYYASFDPQRRTLGEVSRLVSFPVPTGVIVHSPSIGVAGGRVYLFWSLERRGGGLTPPSAQSFYLSFLEGQPQQARGARLVSIPAEKHPRYLPVESAFPLRELAAAGPVPATFVYMPCTAKGRQGELPVAFVVDIRGRTKHILQVVLSLWSRGELKGYQIVGQTANGSLRPVLAVDDTGNLHLVWIDTAGFGTFDVYYASTAPQVRARLNRITGQDVMAVFFGIVWGLVQGLSFLPIVLVWVFVPLVIMSIYLFIRAEGGLSFRSSQIVLLVAILLYTGGKYLFRPNWFAALPLPRDLPQYLADWAIYTVPFLITGAAGLVTWFYVKRRPSATLLLAFAIFAGTDALLTLLIYVPGMLAE
ncbi:MAG: hypothetical protein J7M05_07205 [Anaerolineae bacterium]|nr:hypothetical protein [Anaerolineae bacterium]